MKTTLLRCSLWLTMALVMLIASACGGEGAAPAADPEPGDTDGGGATEGGAMSGDLSVVITWSGSELEAFQAVIDGFSEANPDVSVELVNIPFGELNAQLTQQFASGSGPDVTVALPGLIRLFAAEGFLMPLDDLWDGWVADGQYNESLRVIASTPDGTAHGVWFKGNVNALIWHKPERLSELGVEVPESWEEWTAQLDELKVAGEVPLAIGGADGWPLTQWFDPFLTRVAGAEVHDGLVEGTVSWDDPAVVETFEVFGEFIAEYFPSDTLDRGFVDATCAWVDDLAVQQNQGAFVNLVAPGECGAEPGDFTFFTMPSYDESAPFVANISGDLFAVNADTENPEAALALASYLGSAEAQSIWAARGGFVAPNATVSLDTYPTDNDRRAAELWPRDADALAAYDLDDFIGGQIQSTEVQALQQFVRDQDVEAIVNAMVEIDQQVRGG